MHSIRLRHPWQCEWIESTATTAGERIARYQRTFHRPTGLTDHQAVWLRILSPRHSRPTLAFAESNLASKIRHVTLNAQVLVADRAFAEAPLPGMFQARLDGLLSSFNHLQIEFEFDIPPASPQPPELGSLAEVRIEISD